MGASGPEESSRRVSVNLFREEFSKSQLYNIITDNSINMDIMESPLILRRYCDNELSECFITTRKSLRTVSYVLIGLYRL